MCRLQNLTSECEFTNADEFVKFLFSIHKKHTEAKQEFLKHVDKETTLGQFLEYACNTDGNLQSVELSKYVDKVQPGVNVTEANINTVEKKKLKSRRCDVTPAR